MRTPVYRTNDNKETTMSKLANLIKKEEGVTAIEYGLIAALIAVAIIAAVTLVGTKLQGTFSTVSSNLK
jgi:pilus assembly protein Flp/PilA